MGKVLIADPSAEYCAVLIRTLSSEHEVRCCGDGFAALQLAESFQPQVLILSLSLPGLDGLGVLDALAQKPDCPKTVVLTHFISAYIEQALSCRPVSYAMMKPCDMQAPLRRVDELMGLKDTPAVPLPDPSNSVAALIYHVGISPLSLPGRYICAGVECYLQDPDQAITKELYPALAKKFGKTAMSVEKAIRQGVAQAWERRDERVWRQYFQILPDGTLPKPTNQQFLQAMTRCLQQNIRDACVNE